MNQLESAHRSVRRFFAEALSEAGVDGAAYRMRMEDEQIADADRPQAVVLPITDVDLATPARVSIPQGDVQYRQTFACTAYPETEGTSRGTRLRATEVADRLLSCIVNGMVDADGEYLSAPLSIPFYDYTGVPVEGSGRTAVPADPINIMDVISVTARPLPDPVDDRRWTVGATVRVTWWAGGRTRPGTAAPPLVDRLIPDGSET